MSKKRPISHITGDKAIDVIKSLLPSEWVIRSMLPDYGIDLLIELFDYIDKDETICETLGEFLFVQVKGTSNVQKKTIKVHPVYNVAKSEWKENKDEFIEIDVVSYSIDTALLDTVKRVGVSVCVMLFLVDTKNTELYSICLNDALDKYIKPKNPKYSEQKFVTIDIPIDNKIDGTYKSLVPLRLYGKRSKLYSAFSTIRYQLNELTHEIHNPEMAYLHEIPEPGKSLEFVKQKLADYILFFADQLLQLDIWNIGNHLFALGMCKDSLDNLVSQIKEGKWNGHFLTTLLMYKKMGYDDDMSNLQVLSNATLSVWNQLDNMNNVYEEICREWFLPKFIGQLGSYPHSPKIKKVGSK